ncbi:MAG: hypothetical protein LPK02_07035 [Rhodobacterales bacterium]|nr:hypothetical protein [Rhodobacterales bacterium]
MTHETTEALNLANSRLEQLTLVLDLLMDIRAMETAVLNGTTKKIMMKIDEAMDVINGMERKA